MHRTSGSDRQSGDGHGPEENRTEQDSEDNHAPNHIRSMLDYAPPPERTAGAHVSDELVSTGPVDVWTVA